MFRWLRKDPVTALEQQYGQKLEQARDLQRKGDIVGYSAIIAEAESILAEIRLLEGKPEKS